MEIKWTSDLSTGVEIIDNQHKELIKRISDLLNAMKQGKGKGEIRGMIQFLADYVVEHFSDEEKYMKLYSYDEMKQKFHITQHGRFVQDVSQFKKKFEENGVSSSLAIEVQNKMLGLNEPETVNINQYTATVKFADR